MHAAHPTAHDETSMHRRNKGRWNALLPLVYGMTTWPWVLCATFSEQEVHGSVPVGGIRYRFSSW